ncbi:MAG: hypothetical protein Q7J13_09330 [Brevundimonas sp.]|nr:hypothetical protein [Brevundimonas sp.]
MLTLAGAKQQPDGPAESARAAQQAPVAQADQSEASSLARIAGALEKFPARGPTAEEKNDAKEDLKAQKDMAFWALVVALASMASVGVGIFGIHLLGETLRETRKAVKEAKKATKAAQSAASATWIIGKAQAEAILSVTGGWVQLDPGGGKFGITLENVGQTPAYDLRVRAVIFFEARGRYIYGSKREPLFAQGVLRKNAPVSKNIPVDCPAILAVLPSDYDGKNVIFAVVSARYKTEFGDRIRASFRLRGDGITSDGIEPLTFATYGVEKTRRVSRKT